MGTNGQDPSGAKNRIWTAEKKRPRGKPFKQGNPGRKPGSRNGATLMKRWLTEDDKDAFYQKGKEMALSGEPRLLKLFLERFLPRDCSERMDLPVITNHRHLLEALTLVLRAVATGKITFATGAELTAMLAHIDKTLSDAKFEEAMERDEKEHKLYDQISIETAAEAPQARAKG